MENEFRTRVIWVNTKPENPDEEGFIIMEMLNKAARTIGIKFLNELILRQAYRQLLFDGTELKRIKIRLPSLPQFRKLSPDFLFGTLTESMTEKYKLNIYHMQNRMNELYRLGLPEDQGIVALNPYSDELVCWYL